MIKVDKEKKLQSTFSMVKFELRSDKMARENKTNIMRTPKKKV